MEYFFLLVLAFVWWGFRSRDRKASEEQIRDLINRIFHLENKVRDLESSIARARVDQIAHRFEQEVTSSEVAIASSEEATEIANTAPSSIPEPQPYRVLFPPDAVVVPDATYQVSGQETTGVEAPPASIPEEPPLQPQYFPSFNTNEAPPRIDPNISKPAVHATSLEERLGTNWLNKLGIITLVIGVSFFLAYQLRTLGALGKVIVGYLVSSTLLLGGVLLERKERYKIFARAGIGGGWALTFFTAFAMYHIEATRVLNSQAADLVLMLLIAVGMVWHSLRYKSQVVTGLAFLLAFSTVTLSHVTGFSLTAGAVLASGLVIITTMEHWVELETAGLISVYLNHFLWLYRIIGNSDQLRKPFPEFLPSAALLIFYWLIFRIAYIRREPKDQREDLISTSSAILNSIGLLSLMKYQSIHPEWAFWALLGIGTAEMLLALYARPKRRSAFIVLSIIASALLVAAIPFHFSGNHWSLLWLLEAEILLLCGIRLKEVVFRRLGVLSGVLSAIPLLIDAIHIFFQRQGQPDGNRHIATSVTFAAAALLYWGNSQIVFRRWKELFVHEWDVLTLRGTSYLGLASFASMLWLVFPGSATVIAWMALVLVLGIIADRYELQDIALQCDLLATASLLRIFFINLEATTPWFHVTQRAITVLISSGLYYACTRRKTTQSGVPNYVPSLYSWIGSGLLSLLAWYELHPVSVAVAWMLLGLLLFELGFSRKHLYLRYQAYTALIASFVRIFFVNINAGEGSHHLTPRLYTVIPLVAAYFWIYVRTHQEVEDSKLDRLVGNVAACLGTISLATLGYFEFTPEWVADGWAILLLGCIAIAWFFRRQIFLLQTFGLAIAVFLRAVLFNLAMPSLSQGNFWSSRIACISIAALIVFLSLPIAFRLRATAAMTPNRHMPEWLQLSLARPEQLLFFMPLVLVTILLAHEMRAGMITIAWSTLGVAVFLFALLVRERSYRLAGLGLLLLGVGKILVIDIWKLAPTDRYITLIVMGAALLLVSFLYTRYREAILKFL